MLYSVERQILKCLYGQIQDKGRWRRKCNSENCKLYKDLNIVGDIKIRRLRWAGHIRRVEYERIPKKVLNGKFPNTRPMGKPRISWKHVWRDILV
jgi:hypothetical protein